MGNKGTSSKMATTASKALQDGRTNSATKALAASVLAQSGDRSSTSSKVASLASEVLSNAQSSQVAKSLAASALSQSE
jgi:hypothetical protein